MGVNSLPNRPYCYPTASRLRFEPGPFCARVQHANHSATEPAYTPALHPSRNLIGFARFAEVVLGRGGEQLHYLLRTGYANVCVCGFDGRRNTVTTRAWAEMATRHRLLTLMLLAEALMLARAAIPAAADTAAETTAEPSRVRLVLYHEESTMTSITVSWTENATDADPAVTTAVPPVCIAELRSERKCAENYIK